MVTLQDAMNLPSYLQVLTSVNGPQRRGNPKAFIGLDNSAEYQSEGMLVRAGGWGSTANGVLAQVHVTVNGMGL